MVRILSIVLCVLKMITFYIENCFLCCVLQINYTNTIFPTELRVDASLDFYSQSKHVDSENTCLIVT